MKICKYEFKSVTAWDMKLVESYVEFQFKFPCWFIFTIPNASFSSYNPLLSLKLCLEHLCIKAGKYERLKERAREQKVWKYL